MVRSGHIAYSCPGASFTPGRCPGWKTSKEEQRWAFVIDAHSQQWSMTELCERYQISRPTGYKWVRRYREEGAVGLEDRSRAPHRCPHRMSEEVERALLAVRRRHPTWGPRKLLAWLAEREPQLKLPAPGRVGALLAREGLIKKRRRRPRRWVHPGRPRFATRAPNDLWTADFKGRFRLGDRSYCYPLTVADPHTRYVLGVHALDAPEGDSTRTRLERIRFDRFRRIFNQERPHEALGQKPPATHWHPSPRSYPEPVPAPDYPERFEVRWVSDAGSFCWKRPMFIGMPLAGKRIGLEEIDDGIWSVYFHRVLLGRFDERKLKLYPKQLSTMYGAE